MRLNCTMIPYIDGLMWERYNSSALAMELHLSCTNPLISCQWIQWNEMERQLYTKLNIYSTHCRECGNLIYGSSLFPHNLAVTFAVVSQHQTENCHHYERWTTVKTNISNISEMNMAYGCGRFKQIEQTLGVDGIMILCITRMDFCADK